MYETTSQFGDERVSYVVFAQRNDVIYFATQNRRGKALKLGLTGRNVLLLDVDF